MSIEPDTARLKAILLLSAAIAFAVAPFFITGFDGFDPNAFPVPQTDPPVQPAGYAFAIWGLIYLWLIVHAVWGLFQRSDDPDWDAPRWPLFLSLAIGASWLAVANASPPLATVQIWVMLLTALAALFATAPGRERWLLTTPVALYAGWLTAASWVSVGLMLGGYGIVSGQVAALVSLAGAGAMAFVVQSRLGRAPEYGVAVVWALMAVVVANGTANMAVAGLALGLAAVLGGLILRAARAIRL